MKIEFTEDEAKNVISLLNRVKPLPEEPTVPFAHVVANIASKLSIGMAIVAAEKATSNPAKPTAGEA